MNLYQQFVLPILQKGDAEKIHEQTLTALAFAQKQAAGRAMLRQLRGDVPTTPIVAFGLTFPNVLGIAAGFDKDVRVTAGLATLGFGHIETGTLTPRPQVGNPKPRVFRLADDQAIINRMGFPNGGVAEALPRLRKLAQEPRDWVLGVSLGKQKETALDDAADDYVSVMRQVYEYADYVAVNISSPNTPGLRKLQGKAYLDAMLGRLQETAQQLAASGGFRPKPLLLKIAPDLEQSELDAILQSAETNQIAGIIATNTTLSREGLTDPNREQAGGMSGVPLQQRSNEIIRYIAENSDLPIIGVGGVRSAEDVQAKLEAGATLVQLYTGLVYQGPTIAGKILRGLSPA